jgi:hypothetical protein
MIKTKIFFVVIISVLIFSGIFNIGFSQDATQINFINELDSKVSVTYGDALIMFRLQSGSSKTVKSAASSAEDPFSLKGYTEAAPLNKGMASLMTAKYLKLGGSFMYMIIGTERYAYKACIANGIFSGDGSENDKMTGPELIELFTKISDLKGGN